MQVCSFLVAWKLRVVLKSQDQLRGIARQHQTGPVEGTMLSLHCVSDHLGKRHRPVPYQTLTM